jgi:hypothetical protein
LIVIIARFETKPDYSERWPELVAQPRRPRRVRPRRGVPRRRRRRSTRQQRSLQGRGARPPAGAGVHAPHHQPDHRCDRLVRDGADEGQLTGFDKELAAFAAVIELVTFVQRHQVTPSAVSQRINALLLRAGPDDTRGAITVGCRADQSSQAWARIRFPRPRTRDGRARTAAPRAPARRSHGA